MQKLICFRSAIAALLLLALSACGDTAGNMSREISGWFNTDNPPRGTPTRDAPTQQVETIPAPVAQQPLPATLPPRAAKVAVLLPLSGQNAALGKGFLDAAHMAVADLADLSFELVPKDVGTDAGRAAQSALAGGAQLLIGPVFSSSIPAVKEQARQAGVPVLSLSNDWNAAGAGVYIMGFNPAQQVRRALEHVAARGIRRIGILAPNNQYGDITERAAYSVSGIEVVFAGRYGTGARTIKQVVEQASGQRANIQGLLIAEGGQGLADIAKALTEHALSSRDVQMIGTGLWDDENVAAHNVLLGAVYAAPEPSARTSFAARYEKAYGKKPARLASLAYDAVALAAVLARQGQEFNTGNLTNPNGFAGLDGIFRLNLDGTAERGLAVLEVNQGGARVVEPAPRRF